MGGRLLSWDSLRNARDLGGVPVAGGGTTRFGAVVRTETTRELTSAGWSAARDFGVSTVLDLREPEEIRRNQALYAGSVLPGAGEDGEPEARLPYGVSRTNVPVLEWTTELGRHLDRVSLAEPDAAAATRAVYLEILRLSRARLGRAVQAVAEAPPGAVLVHCHAGKDRTGLVSALLLSLAGAHADVIADDYAVSETVFEPYVELWLEGCRDDRERELRLRATKAPRQAMLDVLGELEDTYGGAAGYLLGSGLAEDALTLARDRLVGQ